MDYKSLYLQSKKEYAVLIGQASLVGQTSLIENSSSKKSLNQIAGNTNLYKIIINGYDWCGNYTNAVELATSLKQKYSFIELDIKAMEKQELKQKYSLIKKELNKYSSKYIHSMTQRETSPMVVIYKNSQIIFYGGNSEFQEEFVELIY